MTNAQSEAINVASGAQGILHSGEWSTIMISNNFFRQNVKKWDTLSICNQDDETQQSFITNITVYTQVVQWMARYALHYVFGPADRDTQAVGVISCYDRNRL